VKPGGALFPTGKKISVRLNEKMISGMELLEIIDELESHFKT